MVTNFLPLLGHHNPHSTIVLTATNHLRPALLCIASHNLHNWTMATPRYPCRNHQPIANRVTRAMMCEQITLAGPRESGSMIPATFNKIWPCHIQTNNEVKATMILAQGQRGHHSSRERSLRTIKTFTKSSHIVGSH